MQNVLDCAEIELGASNMRGPDIITVPVVNRKVKVGRTQDRQPLFAHTRYILDAQKLCPYLGCSRLMNDTYYYT
jgi:hypothetical protein